MLRPITPETATRLACLVIGPAGIGKTSLLRTICGQKFSNANSAWEPLEGITPEKAVVLSAESGLLCVRDLVQRGEIEGFEIGGIEDFQEAQRLCLSPEFKNKGYRWIFIDSLTEIASRCARRLADKYPGKNDTFKLWGEYDQMMTDIVKAFRDLTDYNVVFTCLEETRVTENGTVTTPAVEGSKLKNRLTSYFDEVFHMERVPDGNGSTRVAFATQRPVGMAKDRSGRLTAYEAPNLLYIQQQIFS